jgi:hypothetical protein
LEVKFGNVTCPAAQGYDTSGVELPAAGVGVDRGEDGAGGDVLAVAGGIGADVAAEDGCCGR